MTHRWKMLLVAAIGAVVGMAIATSSPHTPAVADQHEGEAAEAITTKQVSLAQAHQAIKAAKAEAEELGVAMDIAIVDAGANLKAFARMDGAWLGSVDIAMKKARTSALFHMNTGVIGELSQPGEALYQIEVSNEGLITFPGGVPIADDDGNIIGAIGVSGSTVEHDHQVATAGAEAIGNAP